MFGYVTVNKPELKIREFERYQAFYCGLCRSLGKRHGAVGRLTLTYDMTFLVLLLTSLYEPKTEEVEGRCLVHPAKKHRMLFNEISGYAADMNILLCHDHLEDDWRDERKLGGLLGMKVFAGKKKKVAGRYARQAGVIANSLEQLAERERNNCENLDEAARPFGTLMGELFVWKEDSFQEILRSFGFYLGKYIYLLDAYVDLEEDRKKGCYNPFVKMAASEDFDERAGMILDGTRKMAIVEFEKLPCEQDLEILRNILYEGILGAYAKKRGVRGWRRE